MPSSFAGDAYQDDYELAEGLRKKVEVWDNKAPPLKGKEGHSFLELRRVFFSCFLFINHFV